jgi:hypothetical protein
VTCRRSGRRTPEARRRHSRRPIEVIRVHQRHAIPADGQRFAPAIF